VKILAFLVENILRGNSLFLAVKYREKIAGIIAMFSSFNDDFIHMLCAALSGKFSFRHPFCDVLYSVVFFQNVTFLSKAYSQCSSLKKDRGKMIVTLKCE
jgi:hypothetical protein